METKFADFDIFFYFSRIIFKKNHVFVEEGNPSEKNVIANEEVDGTDIDDIGNLEHLLRLVFIYEECENLKVFVDGGKLTRNINEKKKPRTLQMSTLLQMF